MSAFDAGQATKFIVGAGAEGRIVFELWRAAVPCATFLFVDDDEDVQRRTDLGAPVLGGISKYTRQAALGETVVALGDNRLRMRIVGKLREANVPFGRVIASSAEVFASADVAEGAILHAGVVVNAHARVGAHVIVNTGAIVEHDCVIEEGATLSPGVVMGGRVQVGRGSFISAGVVLAPRVMVGAGSVIGAGAVVTRDVPGGVLAFGVPARVIRPLGDDFAWSKLL